MDELVIEGVPPYDGRYEYDLFTSGQGFRGYELSWIKRFSGYLVVDIDEKAFGDHELINTFAVIVLCRAGKITEDEAKAVFDRFQHVEFEGRIRVDPGEREPEADAGPPPSSSSENGGTSGAGSGPSSETLESIPASGGSPVSASSVSAPPRSGN